MIRSVNPWQGCQRSTPTAIKCDFDCGIFGWRENSHRNTKKLQSISIYLGCLHVYRRTFIAEWSVLFSGLKKQSSIYILKLYIVFKDINLTINVGFGIVYIFNNTAFFWFIYFYFMRSFFQKKFLDKIQWSSACRPLTAVFPQPNRWAQAAPLPSDASWVV